MFTAGNVVTDFLGGSITGSTCYLCSKCNKIKSDNLFHNSMIKCFASGRRTKIQCKDCISDKSRLYRKTPEFKNRMRELYNTDKYKQYIKKYRQTPKRVQYTHDYVRKYRPKYVDRALKRILFCEDITSIKLTCSKCGNLKGYESFQPNKLMYSKEHSYCRECVNNDLDLKLSSSLRRRVRNYLLNGNIKYGKTLELVGCDIYKLKSHLESKFSEGMNWGNYGDWEIDHIKPISLFNLSNEVEQRTCFHYTNLQPLWKFDNRSKSDNYIGDFNANV